MKTKRKPRAEDDLEALRMEQDARVRGRQIGQTFPSLSSEHRRLISTLVEQMSMNPSARVFVDPGLFDDRRAVAWPHEIVVVDDAWHPVARSFFARKLAGARLAIPKGALCV